MKTCNECHSINADSAEFCSKCGTKLGESIHNKFKRGQIETTSGTNSDGQPKTGTIGTTTGTNKVDDQPFVPKIPQTNSGKIQPMSFSGAVHSCMVDNYASFYGRATRKEFWYFLLFSILVQFGSAIVLSILAVILSGGRGSGSGFASLCLIIISLALICPSICVCVRRLHDIGKSGWWHWIGIIPLVGPIISLIFWCTESEKHDNQYGEYIIN